MHAYYQNISLAKSPQIPQEFNFNILLITISLVL